MTKFSLWLDKPDAKEQAILRASGDALLEEVGLSIIDDGFAVLDEMVTHDMLSQIINDYQSFINENPESAQSHCDKDGRHFRLANFHIYSDSALRMIKADRVMRVIDYLFGERGMLYTSLAFEYSTEQRPHRDTPYFFTRPEGLFFGVWFPLEDVHEASGPLVYFPGSHRIDVDQLSFLDGQDPVDQSVRLAAIARYQQYLRDESFKNFNLQTVLLKRGQMAIWHPQLVHGGSRQTNPCMTRRSMVFHVSPESTPVFKDDVFFGLEPAHHSPYKYAESYGRFHAKRDRPSFMNAR